jgi:hypothetical protein
MGPGMLSGFNLGDEKTEPSKCLNDSIEGRRNKPGNVILAQIAKDVSAGYHGVLQLTKTRPMMEDQKGIEVNDRNAEKHPSTKDFKDFNSLSTRPTDALVDESSSNVEESQCFTMIAEDSELCPEPSEQNPNIQSTHSD